MSAGLIVFVDGLGADVAAERGLFSDLPDHRAIVPGVGYSVNIQAELFAGTSPDQAGFFCHWQYAPAGSRFRRLRPLLEAWSAMVPSHGWVDVQAHRLLARGLPAHRLGVDTLRIPFRELPWLGRAGEYHTVTGDCDLFRAAHLVSWAKTGQPAGRRDPVVFEAALDLLRRRVDRPVVTTLVDLDAIGHDPGPGSPAFEAATRVLDARVRALVSALDAYAPGAPVVVLSDHGQSPVTGAVDLAAEGGLPRILGRPRPDRWTWFVDSTIARVWSPDVARLEAARAYLGPRAHVLSEAERRRFGVIDPRFGDVIAIAPEGTVFRPSHFAGRAMPRGMHGYHPDARSQWAAWASRGIEPPPPSAPLAPIEAHQALRSAFLVPAPEGA